MGDFTRGLDESSLPASIRRGLANHRSIDAFTDIHPEVLQLRKEFSPHRRRVAGIIIDVVFDHFLIRDWSRYHLLKFESFLQNSFEGLKAGREWMPLRMQTTVEHMTTHPWLQSYQSLTGVAFALDRMSERSPVARPLAGSLIDLERLYDKIESVFQHFMPQLCRHVETNAFEGWTHPVAGASEGP